jgi:NitT/TauT family transport system substrate-binding protein
MKKKSRLLSLQASLAMSLSILLLCTPSSHANDAAPISTEKVTINVGYPMLAPIWGGVVLTADKLWKKYLPNVEVNRVEFMSGMPVVNNMTAGKIDIGYFADMPAIVLASQANLTETIFIAITDADEGGAASVYVKKDSPIKSVKDLKGKRISVPFGGYTHRFAELLEASEKIKFTLVGQSPEVGLSSLQAGTVDAYIPWPPYGALSASRGYGRKLLDGTNYKFGALRGVVVSREFAKKHPNVVVGWLRAELDAHNLLRNHKDYAAKLIHNDWKKYNVPLEVIKEDFAYKVFPDEITPEWRKVMIDSADFLREHKFIDKQIDFDKFIDDSYLRKAAAIPSQLDSTNLDK